MDKQALLDHVEKSPKAVGVHDKAAWLDIFAEDYSVEDPVGSTPHTGEAANEAISRFYDTFIAPNDIHFNVAHDIVNDMHVVRDLTVHTGMSEKLKAEVPMHLLYQLKEVNGELRIHRLAAHWELMPMMGQVFSNGFAAFPVLSSLTARMFRYQGVGGILGFSRAAFNVGNKGKRIVDQYFEDLNQKHMDRVLKHIEKVDTIMFGEKPYTHDDVNNMNFDHFETGKMIAAGNFVTVSFMVHIEGLALSGVAFFEFDKGAKHIVSLRFYC